MSLILEALRKSEAERRRGLPPDLHAELPPTPARRARAMPAAAWAMAAVASVALLAWWFMRTPAMREEAVSGSAARNAPDAPVAVEARAQRAPLPGLTPLPDAAAPSAPAGTAPAPASVTPDSTQAAPAQAVPIDPGASPLPATPPRTAATTVPNPPADAAPPVPGRPLSLSELDPGARDALPPLRMSMHLWNETPALRFAIIDGQRVSEGDTVGEVRIARIERDGVLLEWQGRTILLPVR